MSFDDDLNPVKALGKGLAEGALEWSSEKIERLLKKFTDKDLAFIEDQETINLAKESRHTGEWDFFKEYVDDKDLRILFQSGLALRKLDNEKDEKNLKALQLKIRKKYDYEGLHISFFVQNGLFSKYVAFLLEQVPSMDKFKMEIRSIFEDIDKKVIFISNLESIEIQTNEIVSKLNAHSPKLFIISSSHSARKHCKAIKEKVSSQIRNYIIEEYNAPAKMKEIYFFIRSVEL